MIFRGIHAKSLGVAEPVGNGGGHEADPPLRLLNLRVDKRLRGGDGEGPEEVGEEGGVEVAEPEEGDLKRGASRVWGEELGGIAASGEVEGMVVGLEVGEESGGVGGQ
ncbi:uncharacterized protein A4U43_C05F30500 [Asparagus officinalis]|uniref:Uncharacterized protein n=1 Tax=Asparagus officinalis TaxID=4686 RepID=A0A5P1EXE9_ASPOF|nr:uncharacterized protein A4U43_C05F30500 [Asparagus officinalis]